MWMWRKSGCIIRPCEQGWGHSGKHITHFHVPSCLTCLLRLLRDKLWLLSPRSHFVIGSQCVMTFWWLNMERGSKSLGLSSCWSQLVQLLSCWKEIHHTLFSAFCHSSHTISYFGLWQVPPLPGPVISPTAREPLSPHLPLKMEMHFLGGFSSCLTGKRTPSVWRLLALLANDPAVEGRRWAARFPVKVGPARNLCQCCECVLCASLCS